MNEFTRKAMELVDELSEVRARYHAGRGHWSHAERARAALLAHLEGGEQKPSDSLKDSLRLDWCERHAVGIENLGSGGWQVFGDDTGAGKTLRAAIDSAAFPATPTEESP